MINFIFKTIPVPRLQQGTVSSLDKAQISNLPLGSAVNHIRALFFRQAVAVIHALEGVGFKVAQVLVDQSIVIDVHILPLTVSPLWETT